MGDKINEKTSSINILDEAILANDKRQGYLKTKLVFENDPKARETIKEELKMLDQQRSFTIDAKKHVEQELQKAKEEERRKYIENLLKAGYFIGKMRENIRANMERDRRFDKDMENIQSAQFERAVDKIFNTLELNHVTKDMIEDIAQDKEFEEMVTTGDVNRYERKEEEVKVNLESALDKALMRSNKEDLNADFGAKQRRVSIKVVDEEKYYHNASVQILSMMNSDYFKRVATAEDKQFYEKLYEDVSQIWDETSKLYKDMKKGESSFEKGNGFTKVLIEKEAEIEKNLNDYNKKLLARIEEGMLKDPDSIGDTAQMYAASMKFVDPIIIQNGLDKENYRVNELRTRMEMWQVYQRLPKGTALTKKQLQKASDDEYKAWAKIERIRRTGGERGGIEKSISEWVTSEAIDAFNKVKDVRDSERNKQIAKNNKLQLSPKDKEAIKLAVAKQVLASMVTTEMKRKLGEDKSHYEELINFRKNNGADKYDVALKGHFHTMAVALTKDPDFEKSFNKHFSSKNFSTSYIKFMADNVEQKIAKDLMNKPLAKNLKPEKKEPPKKDIEAPVLAPNNYN